MIHLFQNEQIFQVRMPGLVELIIVMCLYANQGIASPPTNQEEEAEVTELPPEPNLISVTVESTESMSYVRCGKI